MKSIFHYLAALNVFDAFVTHYGLSKGLIVERNVLMDGIYHVNPWWFLMIKIGLSFCLLLFIFFERIPSSNLVRTLSITASLLYTFVFILHCGWLLMS